MEQIKEPLINWDDFQKVELRVGTIVEVQEFPEALKPAYRLRIDFGEEVGVKKIQRPDHRPVQQRRVTGQTDRGSGQFSGQADRTVHVRMPGYRISSPGRSRGTGDTGPGNRKRSTAGLIAAL